MPTGPAFAPLARAYVGVRGPGAADYLQRMVSNDVEGLEVGGSCEAMLLTPKARVIAVVTVVRRADDDFLLIAESELGDIVREHLVRFRFAARADIAREEHSSVVVFGAAPGGALAVPTHAYGVPAVELVDGAAPEGAQALGEDELEALRIRAGTVAARDIDDRVLPAEAGLVERAVDFEKGCYPGQEPIARLHYRGHGNRGLRVLSLRTAEPPVRDAEVVLDGKSIGRVTSAVRSNGEVVALAYVRAEVPEDAVLRVGDAEARPLD
jgi:folate-binding protein YgfZ